MHPPAAMTHGKNPIVRVLDSGEAQALLARNRVGRIAYSVQGVVEIEPVHYVCDLSWIFGRTGAEAKLLTLPPGSWCAFETDEVRGMWDWESVVVKGPFTVKGSPGADWDHDRAVSALRQLLPTALTVYDPTPHRDTVFGVQVAEISGRQCLSNGVFEGQPLASQKRG